MLNLDETFEINNTYVVQRDLYLRGFLYSFGVVVKNSIIYFKCFIMNNTDICIYNLENF